MSNSDKWGAPGEVNPDYDRLWRFVESDRYIDTPAEAIELYCILQSWVARTTTATDFPTEPIDGFCDRDPSVRLERERRLPGEYFRNSGNALRFIAKAVREAAARRIVPT